MLPKDHYIVRKLNTNKTQILHRIRLRIYEPNTDLQDVRPEGNLQPDDEIVITQDDLYVIMWETNFGDFDSGRRNATHELPTERSENMSDAANEAEQPDQILTEVDLGSTRRDTTEATLPDQIMHESDDETSSGGVILSWPKYYKVKFLEEKNISYDLTQLSIILMNTDTSQIYFLPVPAIFKTTGPF